MAKRKKEKKFYNYECTITGESFKVSEKAESPDDLVCVNAYYELNPEMDDRPADIKKKLGVGLEASEATTEVTEE